MLPAHCARPHGARISSQELIPHALRQQGRKAILATDTSMAIRGLRTRIAGTIGEPRQLLLLPLLAASEEILIGGQAVIEGVMMRSPQSYAVAVRRPSGTLAVTQDSAAAPGGETPHFQIPDFPRFGHAGTSPGPGGSGLALLSPASTGRTRRRPRQEEGEAQRLGVGSEPGLLARLFRSLLQVSAALPGDARQAASPFAGNLIVFNLLDGTIRMVLFLALLIALSQWKEIQRLFEYHGAEHKVVWAYEKRGPIDVHTARGCSRFHPRCGTSFLLVVMGVSMIVYLFLPFHSFVAKFLWRILLLPVIAGISYEFIRFAARKQGSLWRWASQPGLWLQRVTTREPDDSQLETAIRPWKPPWHWKEVGAAN